MRTTVNLDEALLNQAQALCGRQERSALLREALNALIQRESAHRRLYWLDSGVRLIGGPGMTGR